MNQTHRIIPGVIPSFSNCVQIDNLLKFTGKYNLYLQNPSKRIVFLLLKRGLSLENKFRIKTKFIL